MILATICLPLSTTHHMPHGGRYTMPTMQYLPYSFRILASGTQVGSESCMQQHLSEHIVKCIWEQRALWEFKFECLGGELWCVLGGVLGSLFGAWESIVMDTGCVTSSAIGNELGSVFGRVIVSVMRACFGPFGCAGWECAIKSNWECPWQHAREFDRECSDSWLWSIKAGRVGVYHRVLLGVYWRDCSGMWLSVSWELTWACESSRLEVCSQV
jgi:hypothetical protein